MSLLAILGRREFKRIDNVLDKAVSRDELEKTIVRIETAQAKHTSEIKQSLDRVHSRIDTLWERE